MLKSCACDTITGSAGARVGTCIGVGSTGEPIAEGLDRRRKELVDDELRRFDDGVGRDRRRIP